MLEWCSAEGVAAIPYGGGTSVVGGVTPDVGDRYNGAVSIDLGELDRVLEVDEVSSAALIEAGATGPGLEEPVACARPVPAPLPAVVRVLHPRRLDRDPGRRAFRDPVDAHRGPGGVRAGDHPGGRVGVASPARLRCGDQPRPHARRLGGRARRDHPGVGARPAPAPAPQLARGSFRQLQGRGRSRPGDLPGGPASRQLPAARRRRDGPDDARRGFRFAAGAGLRVGRSPNRGGDGAGARSCAPSTAARPPRRVAGPPLAGGRGR